MKIKEKEMKGRGKMVKAKSSIKIICLLLVLTACSAGVSMAAGTFVPVWQHVTTKGTGLGQFDGASGITIDAAGDVIVCDTRNSRIHKLNGATGAFMGYFTICMDSTAHSQTYCLDAGEVKSPIDIAFDPAGQYAYEVDPRNFRIQKFDAAGNFVLNWGLDTEGIPVNVVASIIREPAGVAVDAAGTVYVTDIWGSAILLFDSQGNLITSWAHPLYSGDDFRPTDIAISKLGIYVTDYLNNTIYRLDYTGNFVNALGGDVGTLEGQFRYPAGIATDALGNVFVADMLNNRIQVFNGISWQAFDGGAQAPMNRPMGILADKSGNVFVADTFKHRVLKYKFNPATIVIDGCDSGVPNKVVSASVTMTDMISDCAENATNHGSFVSCSDILANGWAKKKLITPPQKTLIHNCAENSSIGY